MIKSKKIIEIIIWISLTLLIFAIHFFIFDWKNSLAYGLLFGSIYCIIYYLQSRVLFPHLQKKGRQYLYIVSLAMLFIVSMTSLFVIERNVFRGPRERIMHTTENGTIIQKRRRKPALFFEAPPPPENSKDNPNRPLLALLSIMKLVGIPITLIIGVSRSFSIESAKAKEREKDIIAEKLKGEVDLLKSQINPHFLFNALNNIYSLSILGSEKTSDSILKLSGILRYVLYECNAETVDIEKEVLYLQDLIELQQLKTASPQNINLNIVSDNLNGKIAPMLLIPFIENSFKHSKIESDLNSFVNIEIENDNTEFNFKIENNIPETPYQKDKSSGIGLENVSKRLKLLYPEKHKLEINKTSDNFTVKLKIEK